MNWFKLDDDTLINLDNVAYVDPSYKVYLIAVTGSGDAVSWQAQLEHVGLNKGEYERLMKRLETHLI